MQLNQRLQATPRNYPRHLRQKNLPARQLAMLAKTIDLGKTYLHPTAPQIQRITGNVEPSRTYSVIP